MQTELLQFEDWSTRAIVHGTGDRHVVFVHSLGADATVWTRVMERLPTGITSVAIDIRGQGSSRSQSTSFSIADLADDVMRVVGTLDIAECALVGMSFGGMIAQTAATRSRSAVRRLVLMDTACTIDESMREAWRERAQLAVNDGLGSLLTATLSRWFPPDVVPPEESLLRELEKSMRSIEPTQYAAAARALAAVDLRENAQSITQSTLVVVGERDIALPPSCSRLLRDLIAGSTLEVLPGLGHCPPLEDASAVARLLAKFLSADNVTADRSNGGSAE